MTVTPYPDGPAKPIVDFVYETPLCLVRGIEAVKTRTGEDADYVIGKPFSIRYRRQWEGWRRIIVPKGMMTDLASVPRFIRSLIDRVGPHLEAAIVHDFLYIAWQDCFRKPRHADKQFADDLFLAGMTAAGVSPIKRHIIYEAVSLFGWAAYSNQDPIRYVEVPQ